jgi:hypothetical protein
LFLRRSSKGDKPFPDGPFIGPITEFSDVHADGQWLTYPRAPQGFDLHVEDCDKEPIPVKWCAVEQISNEIRVKYSDAAINTILEAIGDETRQVSRHFNQSEDFFLQLEGDYSVPHIPIHHDVRLSVPSQEYLSILKGITEQIAVLAPQVLKDLTYFFDPAEILRPCFFQIYHVENSFYLYLLRIDLVMRATESTVRERGTNDTTPWYTSRRLFLEDVIIPLLEVVRDDGKTKSFHIRETISETWIGEQGRGYFVQGIWMDADLTKFFTKLFLPPNKKTYPYYPYLCKYKTMCHSVVTLSPEGRKRNVPDLHRAMEFLLPHMEKIQAEMKNRSFSEELPYFRELKAKVPPTWCDAWANLHIEAYLNQADMREFKVED